MLRIWKGKEFAILGRNLISGSFQGVDRISIKYNLKVISSPDKA